MGNCFTAPHPPPLPSSTASPYITSRDSCLWLGGQSFRFACLNAPELLDAEHCTAFEAGDTFASLAQFGRSVTRTYTLVRYLLALNEYVLINLCIFTANQLQERLKRSYHRLACQGGAMAMEP